MSQIHYVMKKGGREGEGDESKSWGRRKGGESEYWRERKSGMKGSEEVKSGC